MRPYVPTGRLTTVHGTERRLVRRSDMSGVGCKPEVTGIGLNRRDLTRTGHGERARHAKIHARSHAGRVKYAS